MKKYLLHTSRKQERSPLYVIKSYERIKKLNKEKVKVPKSIQDLHPVRRASPWNESLSLTRLLRTSGAYAARADTSSARSQDQTPMACRMFMASILRQRSQSDGYILYAIYQRSVFPFCLRKRTISSSCSCLKVL